MHEILSVPFLKRGTILITSSKIIQHLPWQDPELSSTTGLSKMVVEHWRIGSGRMAGGGGGHQKPLPFPQRLK